jgi:hypothetical protein
MVNFPDISGKMFLVLMTSCKFVTCLYLFTCSLFNDAVNSSDSISLNNWMVVNDRRGRCGRRSYLSNFNAQSQNLLGSLEQFVYLLVQGDPREPDIF